MPLDFGGIETCRPQIITWDPTSFAETSDAEKRKNTLLAQGFVLTKEERGQLLLQPPPVGAHIGVFRILTENGDDRLVWDRRDPNQVREAFQKFTNFIANGFTAFATLSTGKKGHKITEFNPNLEEILMVPSTMPG